MVMLQENSLDSQKHFDKKILEVIEATQKKTHNIR